MPMHPYCTPNSCHNAMPCHAFSTHTEEEKHIKGCSHYINFTYSLLSLMVSNSYFLHFFQGASVLGTHHPSAMLRGMPHTLDDVSVTAIRQLTLKEKL